MAFVLRYLSLGALVLSFSQCIEPRMPVDTDFGQLKKFFPIDPVSWARHHTEMPQFTQTEQTQLLAWLSEGKIETNPQEQATDFAYINSLEKFLETGEKADKVTVLEKVAIERLEELVPTQRDLFWGNVAPKVIASLTSETKFNACSGKILTAFDSGKYYILDGHHRWAACNFLRHFVGHAEDYKKAAKPFRFFEERKIYNLLVDIAKEKRAIPLHIEVQALVGNPQGIARVLFESAKLGHGRFERIQEKEDMSALTTYLKSTMLLDSTLWQWLFFSLSLMGCLLGARLLIMLLRRREKKSANESIQFSLLAATLDTLRKYIYVLAFLFGVKLGLRFLTPLDFVTDTIKAGLAIAVIWLSTILAARIFQRLMLRWQEKILAQERHTEITHLFPLLIRTGKFLLYFLGFLVVLDRVGYNIYSAIAGLSVGGFALALAGREAISHLFAGVSLYLDKVVKEGDYLLLPPPQSTWGRVMQVGLRSTTIRTKHNSILIVPNSLLANNQVENISIGGRKRLYKGKIFLDSATTAAQLENTLEAVRGILASQPNVLSPDIHFMKMEVQGFSLRLQFFVEPFQEYHDTVSAVNLKILHWLNDNGVKTSSIVDALVEKVQPPK